MGTGYARFSGRELRGTRGSGERSVKDNRRPVKGSEEQDAVLVHRRGAGDLVRSADWSAGPGGSSIYDAAVRRMTRGFLSTAD